MIVAPVVDVLQGRIAVGEDVTVRGWEFCQTKNQF